MGKGHFLCASMEILLIAATPFEIQPLVSSLPKAKLLNQGAENPLTQRYELPDGNHVVVFVTGVGPMSTAWHLGWYLAGHRPDWMIQAGIAGAFDRTLQLGDVVQVVTERFGDLGVEEADGSFTDLFQMGLLEKDVPPFSQGLLKDPAAGRFNFLPQVNGLTVQKVHGTAASIAAIQKKYPDVQVESMEGAAFFYAALQTGIPFLQIRSISNYVEPRNREAWNIPLAIEHLNRVLLECLSA